MDPKILIAFIPFFGWAIGDFFIQRCSKKIGTMETLLFISLIPLIVTPFIWDSVTTLSYDQHVSLIGMSFLVFIYAIALFHAFRVTKLSVVESVVALELPITVAVAVILGKEVITHTYLVFFIVICTGVFLASTKSFSHLKTRRSIFERGTLIALVATCLAALSNYFIAIASQLSSPLIAIWYMHVVIGILCLIYLTVTGEITNTYTSFVKNKTNILIAGFADNIGWTGYAYAVLVMPISLTITISEAYIVLAAFLGYYFNKEHLSSHQKIGAVIAITGVILLSFIIQV